MATSSSSSWVKTITTPFRKARTFLNHQQPRDKKSKALGQESMVMDEQLQGEVMACAYEDVQVMWSMLDKSRATPCNVSS